MAQCKGKIVNVLAVVDDETTEPTTLSQILEIWNSRSFIFLPSTDLPTNSMNRTKVFLSNLLNLELEFASEFPILFTTNTVKDYLTKPM